MPNVCSLCLSPHGATVAVVYAAGGRSHRSLAEEFGFSPGVVKRHLAHLRIRKPLIGERAHPGTGSTPGALDRAVSPPAVSTLSAVETFQAAFDQEPMDHQVEFLNETRNLVVKKGRQTGFTQAAAALALHVARRKSGALVAIISPSQRQSAYAGSRARLGAWNLGEELVADAASHLRLANGSQILSLPGSARSARGWAADLVCFDEAAFLAEAVWSVARPLVSATGGRLVVVSTPGLPSGFFYELATNTPPDWASMVVPSSQASTIDPSFLAREKAEMEPSLFAQEYMAEWAEVGAGVRGLMTQEQLDAMTSDEAPYAPLRALDQKYNKGEVR